MKNILILIALFSAGTLLHAREKAAPRKAVSNFISQCRPALDADPESARSCGLKPRTTF
jgi:hypothetical protein